MPHEKSSYSFFLALILHATEYEYFISATADKQTRSRPISGGKDSSIPFTAQGCDLWSNFGKSSLVSSSRNSEVSYINQGLTEDSI